MLHLNFSQKIFKYIRTFGLIAGIRLFFEIRRSKTKGIIGSKIPGLKYPVFIRRDSSDYGVFEEVFIENEYQIKTEEKPQYIIDAGANIGLTALYFLRRYPSASIVCIEPEAANFEILLKNMANYKNVVCLKKALWNKSTNLRIKNLTADSWAFEVVEVDSPDKHSLEAVTLNGILLQYKFPRIDILKLDIEGSEKEVCEANTQWIDKVGCVMVEIHENMRKGAYNSVSKLMSMHNFSLTNTAPLYIFRSNLNNPPRQTL